MSNNLLELERKTLIFRLIGGLGNQLFIYYAGQYFSHKLNCNVKFIFSPLNIKHAQYNSRIDAFVLESQILEISRLKTKFLSIKKKYKAILSKIFFPHIFYSFQEIQYFECEFETQKELINLDLKLRDFSKSEIHVEGFFQDFNYFSKLRHKKELLLAEPSEWFCTMMDEAIRKRPIIVHIRIGDYLVTDSKWGVIDVTYYAKAIRMAINVYKDKEIWVYSDNFVIARLLLKPLNNSNIIFIESSLTKNPAEVLQLMTCGVALITSNSTFSLWSAFLSSDSTMIFYPDPMFKYLPDQIRGVPRKWINVSSEWLTDEKIKKLKGT
jgi:hypothetical protein